MRLDDRLDTSRRVTPRREGGESKGGRCGDANHRTAQEESGKDWRYQ